MIGFRLDSNKYVATGHMMRCIIIAKQCMAMGEQCIFLLADDENTNLLRSNNINYCVMNSEWDKWDESISIVVSYIKKMNIDMLVVDSYYVTEKFMSEMNKIVPVFYIDDMCRQAYAISIALHISQWDDEDTLQKLYKEKKNVKLLTGTRYMPLRAEFTECKNIKEKKQIMITTGGTDPFHITLKVVQAILKENRLNEYDIVAVLGKMNDDIEKLSDISMQNKRVKTLYNISNMSEIMKQSCMAVSAGGGTIYELCACDTPIVSFAFSDDHVGFEQRMQNHNVLSYAGDVRNDEKGTVERIIKEILELIDNTEKNNKYRGNMKLVVDGKGAKRIATYLVSYKAICNDKIH